MYKQSGSFDLRDRRIYMAGISLIKTIGFSNADDFCSSTTLLEADVDADTILCYDDAINVDIEHIWDEHKSSLSEFWGAAVETYADPSVKQALLQYLSVERLHESFERGRLTKVVEYPCSVAGDTLWLRACRELGKSEDGHLCVRVLFIDMTRHHAPDDFDRM